MHYSRWTFPFPGHNNPEWRWMLHKAVPTNFSVYSLGVPQIISFFEIQCKRLPQNVVTQFLLPVF